MATTSAAALKVSRPRLPPLPTPNDLLRMYNVRAKKELSQNFILDPRILNKFVKVSDVQDKIVIEVGPGPGGITKAAIEKGCREIHVIEKDPRFIPSLELIRCASGGRLKINIGDCLNYNIKKVLSDDLIKDWEDDIPDIRMIGNLPFNVSTPLLIRLLAAMQTKTNIYSYGRVPLTFTFQHEVAHRLIAPPSDPERSRLSIFAQNFATVKYLYTLNRGAFVPAPDVNVGVVQITPLKKPYIDLPFPFVEKVVTTVMHGKQKSLSFTAKKLFPKNISHKKCFQLLEMASIEFDRKPFTLTIEELEKICFSYKKMVEDNANIKNYVNRNLKSSMLTELREIREERKIEEQPKKKFIIKISNT